MPLTPMEAHYLLMFFSACIFFQLQPGFIFILCALSDMDGSQGSDQEEEGGDGSQGSPLSQGDERPAKRRRREERHSARRAYQEVCGLRDAHMPQDCCFMTHRSHTDIGCCVVCVTLRLVGVTHTARRLDACSKWMTITLPSQGMGSHQLCSCSTLHTSCSWRPTTLSGECLHAMS